MLKANTIKGRDSIVKSNEAKQLKKLPKESDESTKLNKHSGSFSIPNEFGWDKSWGGKYKLDSVGPSPSKQSSHWENQLQKTEKKYQLDFDPWVTNTHSGKRQESHTLAQKKFNQKLLDEDSIEPVVEIPSDYVMMRKTSLTSNLED